MTTFGNNLRQLLLSKIKDQKIDLTKEQILNIRLTFEKVNGEMRYFIDEEILNKLPTDILNEIEELWISNQ